MAGRLQRKEKMKRSLFCFSIGLLLCLLKYEIFFATGKVHLKPLSRGSAGRTGDRSTQWSREDRRKESGQNPAAPFSVEGLFTRTNPLRSKGGSPSPLQGP